MPTKEYKMQEIPDVELPPMEEIPGITVPQINYGTSVGGSGAPALGADVTSENVAAGITGQGSLATQSSISGSDIVDRAIESVKLALETIKDDVIAAGAITENKIYNQAVTKAKMALLSVDADIIAAGAITENKLFAGAVTTDKIAANAITAAKIAANTITASQIAAGTITATEILTGTITAAKIATGTITANEIAANTITAAKIAANTITASQIAAGTITSNEINVGKLSAISTDIGTITAGTITVGSSNVGLYVKSGGNIEFESETYSSFSEIKFTQKNSANKGWDIQFTPTGGGGYNAGALNINAQSSNSYATVWFGEDVGKSVDVIITGNLNLYRISSGLEPDSNGSYDIGSSSRRWNNLYARAIYSRSITPESARTYNCGGSSNPWSNVYTDAVQFSRSGQTTKYINMGSSGGLDTNTNFYVGGTLGASGELTLGTDSNSTAKIKAYIGDAWRTLTVRWDGTISRYIIAT